MAALTNFLEQALLDHVFRGIAYTPPTTIYLALFTTAPDDAGGGVEVTGGSYARQQVTFSPAVSPDGRISNSAALNYANLPTATIVASGLLTAVTGGTLLMYGLLSQNRVVQAGDSLTVAIGDLNLYLA